MKSKLPKDSKKDHFEKYLMLPPKPNLIRD